ncbi:MAG: hypothetical protein IJI65_01475 [Lachnospiraceae bacterium]|nr:hypothetical protein [Lachnospiraceae bacterium]
MRRYTKDRCIETLDALREAHLEIEKCIEEKQNDAAVDLLCKCQQGAIRIGETIESSEGEGTDEVHLLEGYCEVIWQTGEDIKNNAAVNFKKTEKKLRKLLLDVTNGIKSRIKTERLVVFLPYKASMWDSLESIWAKMKEEPDTITMVIPIPYYDRDAAGGLSKIHYEGTMFPKDVPIEFYSKHDLKTMHPEAIYIHNPYDGANYVTSVSPEYYSSELKNYTDELVYVPYFILGDIDPSNKAAVKGIEHFVTVPAVVNAHKVIVQSEDWRRVYIDIMTGLAGEETRTYWENKIEGSGSPKLERVRNLKAEDYEIPEDWDRLIKKSDGGKKKVIFYNTSVAALLHESEKMIEKIKRVFEFFKENRDDVVLLWRPHPLMEATITSLRPELWQSYKDLVDAYRNEGWGIYDDSPELDRAIAISDAYYGDQSSVVWLYKETGKPIMIQNCDV